MERWGEVLTKTGTCIRLFLPGIHTKTSRVAAAACVRVREEVWAFLLTVKRDTKKFTILS